MVVKHLAETGGLDYLSGQTVTISGQVVNPPYGGAPTYLGGGMITHSSNATIQLCGALYNSGSTTNGYLREIIVSAESGDTFYVYRGKPLNTLSGVATTNPPSYDPVDYGSNVLKSYVTIASGGGNWDILYAMDTFTFVGDNSPFVRNYESVNGKQPVISSGYGIVFAKYSGDSTGGVSWRWIEQG